jgi:glutathione peroxidase
LYSYIHFDSIRIMKKLKYTIQALLLFTFFACMSNNDHQSRPTNLASEQESAFYSFKINSLDGELIDFSRYKGKKVLVVNTASKCGYTPQYEDLQKLHSKYGDKVAVLGFPCNQFGGQEPGNKDEIGEFCKKNYGVTFQLFEKVNVKGKEQHPLYQWLTDKSQNGWNDKAPSWNFCKYLINEKGELVDFFGSGVKPMDAKIVEAINK